jgi:hypothetical protein
VCQCETERELKRERAREGEWKGEDRVRKCGIPEIITQENEAKLLYKIMTRIYKRTWNPSISLHKSI